MPSLPRLRASRAPTATGLLIALLLAPAAGRAQGSAATPAAEAAPSEAPAPPKAEPIPVAEIGASAGKARTQLGEIEKGLALGANAYVTKPFSTKELVGKVKTLLGDESD